MTKELYGDRSCFPHPDERVFAIRNRARRTNGAESEQPVRLRKSNRLGIVHMAGSVNAEHYLAVNFPMHIKEVDDLAFYARGIASGKLV